MRNYLLWFGAVLLSGWMGIAGASPWGLDQRPENLTCVAPERPLTNVDITSQRVFENLSFTDLDPISMSQPPGDPSRWIVAGRQGKIFSFANDNAVTTKEIVLDITDRMQFTDTVNLDTDSQQYGITSFVIHPQFAVHPYLYVAYNAKPGIDDPVHSVVSRFTSLDGGQTFDSFSELILISVAQTDSPWHHLGQIIFGPDGYLYIGLGDGGGGNGLLSQDLNELRGSILRIDINQGSTYMIPPDNPLVGTGFREEIYAWGLRNPWRFTFDREAGELWAGDVGASLWEEVNLIEGGGNYGWPDLEGDHCRKDPDCDTTGMIPPVLEIEHPVARAVIGGYVYRGGEIPSLQGAYIFGDSVEPNVQGLFYDDLGQPFWKLIAESPEPVSAFAEALDGEVYFFRFRSSGIYKLVKADPNPPVSNFPELLSETGCVDSIDPTIPASGLIPYTVNSPLWSDGAGKGRWMALPDGETIGITPDGDFDFPIGTVLMKTFSFNDAPFETRLFVRHNDGGWGGYSYEWEDDLSDAVLLPAGKTKQITPEITWKYPSRNECFSCHTDVAGFSLGPEIAQLNGAFVYPSTMTRANQLVTLDHIGLFTNGLPDQPTNLSALVDITTRGAPVGRKARSYLHSNCSGCHRPNGPVQSNIDFRYSTAIEEMNVCDALPNLGDLGITGAKLLSPGDPEMSIISLRVHSLGINRMPPLGTTVVDTDGTGIIDAWITQADVCDVYPDTDADSILDNEDNCMEVPNLSQRDIDGDGYGNACDNCTIIPNSNQCDGDGDGYGNHCDADFNNDGIVSNPDIGPLVNTLGTADPITDLTCNGIVNRRDVWLLRYLFGSPPGPSAFTP